MPNHITNEIAVTCNPLAALRIVAGITSINLEKRDLRVNFDRLIPQPLHVYHGNLSGTDERDFPLNWNSWNRAHWGTKWNAYDTNLQYRQGVLYIVFDTAWSPPRPFVVAFYNKFKRPFRFSSFDEGWNFALIEEWGKHGFDDDRYSVRLLDHNNDDDYPDFCELCLRLKGYDPRLEDEEE